MNKIDSFFCNIFGKWSTEENFNENDKQYERFINACEYGKLNLAKKIYFSKNINIYEYQFEPSVFKIACSMGRLKVAQWLYSLGGFEDDLNYAFYVACSEGHLKTAKWLYSFGNIDIHVDDDGPFIDSCRYDHPQVAKWLTSIEDNYYVIIKNNRIVDWGFKIYTEI